MAFSMVSAVVVVIIAIVLFIIVVVVCVTIGRMPAASSTSCMPRW
jgi:low affinity Fe/Cu permease